MIIWHEYLTKDFSPTSYPCVSFAALHMNDAFWQERHLFIGVFKTDFSGGPPPPIKSVLFMQEELTIFIPAV